MPWSSEKCRDFLEGNPDIAYCLITDPAGRVVFANDPRFLSFPLQPVGMEASKRPSLTVSLRWIVTAIDR